jgi:excisionase family DNA binding protein
LPIHTEPIAQLHTVESVCERLKISRAQVFNELRDGRLRGLKIGKRRFVSDVALHDFIAAREAESGAAATPRTDRPVSA